ncbi:hypothetical protein DFR55_10456 [Herbinix hemicellulosilytica]|uniref:S-layer protein SbsC C-terminal domain-containing protein n=1 Tax=Herbinix hemicellulosilytica TaxID=1564487 RepID=A0A0H5SXU9_HERHM|nr:hypothetical protein [Herbinix hemicellulosilytica]RBP59800.1 hypothetical protein DFR55_10456 [Herbinix hemicellulosilytica]CRZ35188.1 hypothetical protein HHT355_1990 [Herbinix hemicellulosilytica]
MSKRIIRIAQAMLCLGFLFILVSFSKHNIAFGASSITINTVDYEEENIILNNNGNQKIYFATENDAARNVWDVIPVDNEYTTTIDFSWTSQTTEQVIVIKGETGTPKRVTLRPRAKKLAVSISYDKMDSLSKGESIASLLNIQSSEGTAANPITYLDLEWKKGVNGSWKELKDLTVEQLEKLQIKGADLYFRISAVNDVSTGSREADGTMGRRVSSEVRLKIAKQTTPASVTVDGEKFIAQIKYGKEYRVNYTGQTTTPTWVKVTDKSVKGLALKDIIKNGSNGITPDKKFPAMIIEVRDYATTTKAASKITEIKINEQRVMDGIIVEGNPPANTTESDPNVYISYSGSAAITITIPSASSSNPYQYCIVKPGEELDPSKVTWYSITKGIEYKVLSSKATEGSNIYIRKREIKPSAKSTEVNLASTCLVYNVKYPAVPIIEAKSFTFVKNITEEISFDIIMNTKGKLPFETKIKSIKYGTKEIDFTCTPAEINATDPNVIYTMKVTLNTNELNTMPTSYSRALTITFGNGTVDKTSIKLAIQNPTPASALSTTVSKGKTTGTTSIKVINTVKTGHELVYKITDTSVTGVHTETVINDGLKFESGADITVTAGKYITIYEINSSTKKVTRYSCIQITANHINQ